MCVSPGGARRGWQRWGHPGVCWGGALCVGGPSRCVWGLPNRGGFPRSPRLAQHSPRAQRAAAILFTGGCHGDAGPLRLAQPWSRGNPRTTHPSMHRSDAPSSGTRRIRQWREGAGGTPAGSRPRGPARAPTGAAVVPAAALLAPPGLSAALPASQRATPRPPGPAVWAIRASRPVAGPPLPPAPRTHVWKKDKPGEAPSICRLRREACAASRLHSVWPPDRPARSWPAHPLPCTPACGAVLF